MSETVFYPPKRDPSHPFDPPPQVMQWNNEKPVRRVKTWDGTEAWLITRYEDVRSALTDDRVSADPSRPGFPEKSAAYKEVLGKDRTVRTLDSPEHAVHKRMILRDFTVKRVEELRPAIQDRINAQIDGILAKGPPADIVTDLALPIPTMVICELLGVPYEDRDFFGDRSQFAISSEVSPDVASAAGRELNEYIEKLIDAKDAKPDNDLISRLVVDQLRAGNLTRKEVVDYGRFVLIAGHETTANMIALSTLALLAHPDQLEDLKAHNTDSTLVANAVDELLRYLSVTHTGRRRVAKEDLIIGGQLIKAGEGIIVANNIADRDETVFPNAARLNIRRDNARAHLAFGFGIHQCLGQLLSRVELQLVHSTLWKRIPTLELAVPLDEIAFNEGGSVFGVRSVPVKWT
jgi:cytochrome P450